MTVTGFLDFFVWLCGVLTAVATAYHFIADKRRLLDRREKFEALVYKFAHVTWPKFAEMEATAAVSVLDRLAGPKLFSRRRLFSVLLLLFIAWLVAVAIVLPAPNELFRIPDGFELVTRLRYAIGLGLSIALSITVTRRISIFILRLPATRRMSAVAFGLLLLVHLLLLVVWYPIYVAAITFLEILFDTAQRVIFNRHPFPDHVTIILDDRPRVATTANDFLWLFWQQELHSWLGFIKELVQGTSPLLTPFSRWIDACLAPGVTTEAWHRIEVCMETSADSGVQLARIAFALIFLLACLLLPPLKDIVVKLASQPKPIVPMVLGGMTAVAILVQKGLSFI